jgi:leucyl-tRNA synthetase
MVHCATCGIVPLPKDQLPVLLPENVENWISKGRSPLADVEEFMATTCPSCGGAARRDADTMDTFICSAWYHLRYVDPRNADAPFDVQKARDWLPVDFYIGGAEHANGHLIYFRFVTKVLKDAGLLDIDEPVVRLLHHGMVADEAGYTMSKSRGNVISPIETTAENGVDAARIAMFFFAPSDEEISWRDTGVGGARKLVQRVHDLVTGCAPFVVQFPADVKGGSDASNSARDVRRLAHALLQRFDHAFATTLALNTGIAAVYELLNGFPDPSVATEAPDADRKCYAEAVRVLVAAFAPVAPHLCEELHELLGGTDSIFRTRWPAFDPGALVRDTIEIPVQIMGKVKARIEVPADAGDKDLEAAALAAPRVVELLAGRTVRRVIVVPGRLVNVIA